MPPILATVITLAFVGWLFRRDFREKPNVTSALWLPFLWVFISGSRFPSGWLDIVGVHLGGTSVDDGSPLDALFFCALIGAGIYVLHQRRVNVVEFCRNNQWVTIYLAYCFLAILWSDIPLVALKRWIKLFGQPVMVLVLLTEPDPLESFTRLLKRLAYIWIPVSILFTRYYPFLGRAFDGWTGMPMNTGITTNKNVLGCDCFIVGLFFIWHFLRVRRQEPGPARRSEMLLCLSFLALTAWVLHMAHSSTSIGALALGTALMLVVGFDFVDRQRIGTYLVVTLVVGASAEWLFGIHNLALSLLGRDSTLTGRTDVWHMLLNWNINPIFGVGFESFWQEDRMAQIEAMNPGLVINESHNGYLETYINMGMLGVAITLAMLFATFWKARRALLDNFDFGRFRFAYLAAFIIYNWTEAAFRTHSVPFFMFFLIAIDYPSVWESESVTEDIHPPETDEDPDAVHKGDIPAHGSSV